MESEQSIIPTLQILSGPRAGRLYKIDRDLMVIGRNTDCDLVLEPKTVSRRHAAIVRRKHDHVIKDLGSTRGTFVNGLRLAQPVVLKSGYVIQLGEVQLTFKAQVVEIHEDSDEQSTVYAAIDMATPSDRIESAVKPEEKLRALQKIIQTFGTTLVLSEILEDVLSTLFDIFPHAERGFVLLEDRNRKVLAPEAIRTRSGPAGELSISKSVLQRALKNGQAILGKDVPLEFPHSQSVTEVRIRSLMCVPILDQERRPIGILQIDTRDGRGRFDQDDLDLLVSVAYQISVAVQNARLHGDLIRQHELEQELVFARQVMQAMLPERPRSVPGYDFWDCYEPARHVGGDYYGFLPLYEAREDRRQPARRWAIAVGDVVGKGLPAALLTARLSAEIRLFLQGETDPAQVVSLLNQQLIENGVLDMFITFLLVVLDIPDQRIRVANAGHPCPLIRRRDGTLEEFGKSSSGLPLAIERDWVYEVAETTLEPGDVVMLYTDGVPDAMNKEGQRFGDARIRQLLAAAAGCPSEVGERLAAQVHHHIAGGNQFDDITMVAFGPVPSRPAGPGPDEPS